MQSLGLEQPTSMINGVLRDALGVGRFRSALIPQAALAYAADHPRVTTWGPSRRHSQEVGCQLSRMGSKVLLKLAKGKNLRLPHVAFTDYQHGVSRADRSLSRWVQGERVLFIHVG